MARRVIDDDDLDVITAISHDDPDFDAIREWVRQTGFEGRVGDIERRWLAVAVAHPVKPGTDASIGLSRGAYARRITRQIAKLRRLLRENPDLEPVILLALDTGRIITDAFWRFNRGALARTGARHRVKQREAGRRSGQVRRGEVARKRDEVRKRDETLLRSYDDIARAAHALRRRHHHSRQYSQRWLAQEIGIKLRLKTNTVRSALRKLGIR